MFGDEGIAGPWNAVSVIAIVSSAAAAVLNVSHHLRQSKRRIAFVEGERASVVVGEGPDSIEDE